MALTTRGVHYAYDEYVLLEDASTVRHEYLDGEIYAMAGGLPDHAALAAAVICLLGPQLRPGCRIFRRIVLPRPGGQRRAPRHVPAVDEYKSRDPVYEWS